MEKIPMIVICALSLFITSTYCCLLSGSGGSCLTYGLSFGGRMSFPDGTPDFLSCHGENDGPKLIIFQRPRTFGKGKTIQSMFGRFGVGRIWMSDGNTCQKPAEDANLQCPALDSESRECLDKSIPCHLDLNPSCDEDEDTDHNIPCLLPGSGGSCLTKSLSFGGRIYFPDGAPDYLSCNGENDGPKLIIFQRPRNFGKGKTTQSSFGLFGAGRIWMSDGNTCPKPAGDGNLQCSAPENQLSSCMDNTIPCHLNLTSNSCSEPNFTHRSLLDITPRNKTGYKVEYRIVGSGTDWITKEYSDLEERPLPIPGPLEEGYTYEYWISYKYGTVYGERKRYEYTEPCRDINLNLQLSTLSQRIGMASLVADWTVRELTGPCSVVRQTASVKQMDLDNCPGVHDSTPVTKHLRNDHRTYRQRKMQPNSEYNVSITVAAGHQEFTTWQVIRTQETVPTSHPVNVAVHSYKRSGQLDIRWKKPPCGRRNGRMKYYSVKMTREGVTRVHNVKGTRARYAGFTIGEKFTVQVAAINSHGMGPYCPKFVGIFGRTE